MRQTTHIPLNIALKFSFLLFVVVISWTPVFGQRVKVTGQVETDIGVNDFYSLFVVNQRNRVGNFGSPSGKFEIWVEKSDTILIGSVGFATAKITMNDSMPKAEYYVQVRLRQLELELREVQIFAQRDLKQIYNDIEKLGYDPKSSVLQGVASPLESPITALYLAYSRRARKEREAYYLINEAKKRDLLKELFAKYVDSGIIDLSYEEFDAFIDYIQVPDDVIKNSSQYEFIQYIKMKYRLYEELHKYDGWEEY